MPGGQMGTTRPESDLPQTAQLSLELFGQRMTADMTLPGGPQTHTSMLPAYRALADATINATVAAMAEHVEPVSCHRGCAACCRKLVPISTAEARALHARIAAMPEPQGAAVRARFDALRERLRAAGLLERLEEIERMTDEEILKAGADYFHHYFDCPFLEAEECTIYQERPMACREYMVTSPAEQCFPASKLFDVNVVLLPANMARALARASRPAGYPGAGRVPLAIAPAWVEAHPEDAPPREAVELLKEVIALWLPQPAK